MSGKNEKSILPIAEENVCKKVRYDARVCIPKEENEANGINGQNAISPPILKTLNNVSCLRRWLCKHAWRHSSRSRIFMPSYRQVRFVSRRRKQSDEVRWAFLDIFLNSINFFSSSAHRCWSLLKHDIIHVEKSMLFAGQMRERERIIWDKQKGVKCKKKIDLFAARKRIENKRWPEALDTS